MSDYFLGEIRLFAFDRIPRGWLPCQGQLLPLKQNVALYSLLGTKYGGDGVNTFGLPDLRGRVPINISPTTPLGAAGGSPTHTLTVNEMPAHSHQVSASDQLPSQIPPTDAVWPQIPNTYSNLAPNVAMGPQAVSAAGGSQPHNNMQPYLTLSLCISTMGIFPSRS